MEKWIVGIQKDQTVECIVTYEVSAEKSKAPLLSVQFHKKELAFLNFATPCSKVQRLLLILNYRLLIQI